MRWARLRTARPHHVATPYQWFCPAASSKATTLIFWSLVAWPLEEHAGGHQSIIAGSCCMSHRQSTSHSPSCVH